MFSFAKEGSSGILVGRIRNVGASCPPLFGLGKGGRPCRLRHHTGAQVQAQDRRDGEDAGTHPNFVGHKNKIVRRQRGIYKKAGEAVISVFF